MKLSTKNHLVTKIFHFNDKQKFFITYSQGHPIEMFGIKTITLVKQIQNRKT